MAGSAGRKANGQLKKGYTIKNGRVVKVSGRSRSSTGKKGGSRRRRKSSGSNPFSLF